MITNRPVPQRRPGLHLLACAVAALTCSTSAVRAQGDTAAMPVQQAVTSPATGYMPHARLVQELNRLSQAHSGLVAMSEIARSPGGLPVHAVRIAAGQGAENRSALLIVANAWGPHVIGSQIAIGAIRHLAESYGEDPAVTQLLDRHTVYVIARVNPDAAEALFAGILAERIRNDEAVDDDRDQAVDEDGPDDLNGDQMITMMRVADRAGDWMSDSTEPDLVRRANRLAGEQGVYRLYEEGIDDDDDGSWNEDPIGGVDVNANFSYQYEFFGPASGIHQMSSPEARGVAQFFVDQPNIAAVYVLGPQDNLMSPWRHSSGTGIGGNPQGTSQGGPLRSILQADQDYFEEISDRFKSVTGFTGSAPSKPVGGDVLSFAYYHMGRWAFGSRGWWVPSEPDDDDPGEQDRQVLQWVKQNVPGGFVNWAAVQHPDFPGETVEVGGLRPFVTINPPASLIDSVVGAHREFIVELGNSLPNISLGQSEVEALGERVYRITARVHNDGYLPSVSALGARVRWPRRVRLELRLSDGQTVTAGRAVELIGPIEGSGGSIERSWVVVGAPGSSVTLSASSPVAGAASRQITLR